MLYITFKVNDNLKNPVTVMIRGGKYFLDDHFILTKKDSGTQDCPITYTAYPREKPILSGGRKVIGWKPIKTIYSWTDLPGSKGGKWKSRTAILQR